MPDNLVLHNLHRIPLINTLPPEILSTIFQCLREIRRFKHILPFQNILSQVCRHWRHISLSTPRLWSTVTLFSEQSLPCAEEWLERSGAAPLDVRLDLYDVDMRGTVDKDWIQDMASIVLPHAKRIQSFLIFTYREENAYHILQLFEHAEAPLLERLRISTGVIAEFFTNSLTSSFKGGLPKLSFVALESFLCIPPLVNITTLHLIGVGRSSTLTFKGLVEILQAPLNLVTFSLQGSILETVAGGTWPIQRSHSVFELPSLQNLELISRGSTAIRFLLAFDMPNLRSLHWHVESDSYHLLQASEQFQRKFGKFPLLKYLTLSEQTLESFSLTFFVPLFPSVTHISVLYPRLFRYRTANSADVFRGLKCLEVLAFRIASAQNGNHFVVEVRNIVASCKTLHTILVDAEFLAHLNRTAPEIGRLINVKELMGDNYPDYWWLSRHAEKTPDAI